MKKFIVPALLGIILLSASCSKFRGHVTKNYDEVVAVANRAEGTVSFIDATFDGLIETVTLPGSAEPMYVVHVRRTDKVYVGDRAQNQVHVLNSDTFDVEASIDVGEGVFHMWAGGNGRALWVNNDIDNTVSIIDLATNSVTETIPLDGKPHDVFVTRDGKRAYISILRPDGPDQVYSFDALTYEQTGEKEVGEDPHLFHIPKRDKLFVPCQNTNQVFTLDGTDLETLADTPLEGAHGIFGSYDQKFVVVTGISVGQLYNLRASNSRPIGSPTATSLAVPHNVVLDAHRSKAFVTHSGTSSNMVSVFKIAPNGELKENGQITTGTNPFGLAYYIKSK